MDNPNLTFQAELRQIERRRIEICSIRIALDLEEFDLVDRQRLLKNLLHERKDLDVELNNNVRERMQTMESSSKSSQAMSELARSTAEGEQRKIGVEQSETQREPNRAPVEIITIDTDDDDEEEGFTILNSEHQGRSSQLIKVTDTTQQEWAFKDVLEAEAVQTKTGAGTENRAKPTKIVVLKYKKPLTHSDRPLSPGQLPSSNWLTKPSLCSASQVSRPECQNDVQQPPLCYAKRYRQSPEILLEQSPSPLIPERWNLTPDVPTIDLTGTNDPICTCHGRNPNCRTCRGTPAVIAEGRTLLTPNLDSQSRSSSSCLQSIGKRRSSRPKSYREFDEMDNAERCDLEMQFCQRIVTKATELTDPENGNGNGNDSTTDGWTWCHRLSQLPQIRSSFLNDLKALVSRKAVDLKDGPGVRGWDWKTLLAKRCHSAEEFAEEVDTLVQEMTIRHPRGCCFDSKGPSQRNTTSGVVDCWTQDFNSWLADQITRCDCCIDTCSSAQNNEDRRDLVAIWDIE